MIPSRHHCQSCSVAALREIAGFRDLPRVTSDSKPFPIGGRLFVCQGCGLVQKIADRDWLRETEQIYRDYEMYYQSGSTDQPVFDPVSGTPRGRCEALSARLRDARRLPDAGKLLDVGAGAGAMLAAFSREFAGWRLFGLDLDKRKEGALKQIERFERLFTEAPEQLGERFDLITLVHSLEHFPDPLAMLGKLRERLAPGGRLFVEVNNVERTPFDLVVADHLCHFSSASLCGMVSRAGMGIEAIKDDWIAKELSLLASRDGAKATLVEKAAEAVARTEAEAAWLARLFADARDAARGGRFGIFGTSIAATWLASGLGDAVEFFVDEDTARQGRTHLSRPVLAPAQVPSGSVVYLAFVREVAAAIRQRLASLPVKFTAPSMQPA
jgi:SAM-dependent methyltransferase